MAARPYGAPAEDPTRVWLEARFAGALRAVVAAGYDDAADVAAPTAGSALRMPAPVLVLEPTGASVVSPRGVVSTEGLLADGIYRDLTVGRWTRLALASLAMLALFAAAAVSSSGVAVAVLIAIAVVLFVVRAVLRRPRLVVRAEGLLVVRRLGSSSVAWPHVLSAGAAPAPPPLGQVERVLAIRVAGGGELRVPSLRDAVDRRTGQAPRVVELASALVARANWSNAPR